jgi:hypothetical protein
MICKQDVIIKGETITVEYPAMLFGYYAQDDLNIDHDDVWVEYCDHDGATIFSYNAITEERVYV